jgi:hypothetical protein
MAVNENYQLDAQRVVQSRLSQFRRLTYQEAATLQPPQGESLILSDIACKLWVYVQRDAHPPLPKDAVLVTVQVARERVWGMVSYHTEGGLVFMPHGEVREATDIELRDSGG